MPVYLPLAEVNDKVKAALNNPKKKKTHVDSAGDGGSAAANLDPSSAKASRQPRNRTNTATNIVPEEVKRGKPETGKKK